MLAKHFERLGYLIIARKRSLAGNSGNKLAKYCVIIQEVMGGKLLTDFYR